MCRSYRKAALNVICVFAVSLVFVVITGAFSMIDMPSYAADGVKAIQLVNNGAVAGIQGKQMSNVYFGNYKQSSDGEGGFLVEPIKWRVLQNEEGRLFILTDKNIDAAKPHNAKGDATWETLALRKFLNGYGDYSNKDNFIGTAFTDLERESIAVSHIETPVNPKTGTIGGNPTDDKVFLLSIQEARNTSFGFNWDGDTNDEGRKSENTDYTIMNGTYLEDEPDNRWCLRSMGSNALFLSFVRPAGSISYNGVGIFGLNESFTRAWPFRSACRVDLGSVLFASAAVDGKVSGNTGAGALKAIEAYDGNDWKLTVRDTARKFKVTETEAACCVNEKVELHYTGAEVFDAETAPNEYISAIIVNQSGETLYYGRISRPTAADGMVELNVPRTLDAGTYDLKVFSEQYNGDRKTDYASEMSDISLTVSEPLVPYVNDAGRKQEPKVCKVVAAERETLSSDLSEWYAAVEDVKVNKPVVIDGNVNLILCDGVEFKASFGIVINKSSSLTIWAQSMGAEAGTIDATSTLTGGIGFDTSGDTGKLVINGGKIIAKGNMGSAGIGGIHMAGNGGNVEINGGKVTAEGSKYILNYAEAIGHGENSIISGDLKLGRVKVSLDGGKSCVECNDRISSCRIKRKAVLVERCSDHVFENDVCKYCGAVRPVRIDDESNELKVTLGEQLVYNGEEQTQTVTKITLNGTDITDCCDISDNVQKDADDYEFTIKADPECGYKGTVKQKFTIKRATPQLTVYVSDVNDDLSVSAAGLTADNTSVIGTLELDETTLSYGTNTYNWTFTPIDTKNYEIVKGTIIITVSGHIWEFAGFEWTGNEKDGYTAAKAKYVCKNNADHKDTVSKVTLTDKVTEPTCTEDGKTVYTAVVEKTDSLDGEKHTESKDAKLTDKLGHSWDEGIVTKKPTTTETGIRTFTCTVCKAVRTEILPVLKPDDKEAEEAKEDKTLPTVNIDKTDTVGNYKKKQMKIIFPVNEKIDSYRIQYRLEGKKKWTSDWSTGTGTYVVKNLKKYSLCEFRIAGYVKLDDGTWIRSKWSKTSYRYMSSSPLKAVNAGKKSIRVTWKKDGKSDDYRIQYSLKKNMTGKKTITVKGKSRTKYTIKGLKKGKTYYIRIRPIKKKSGKIYIGILSGTKKTTVK